MRLYIAASGLAVAILLGSLDARAFTLEPLGGNDSGGNSRFADPDEPYDKLADPSTNERSSAQGGPTFTFGTTGSDSSQGPSVNRPGVDNEHLYWNNTSNRHIPFDRNSLRRQYR
jgi:hypothetical protein